MTHSIIRSTYALVFAAACTTPRDHVPEPDASPDASPDAPTVPGGCVKHEDCTSNVCLPDGACAHAGSVAYVDPMGTSGTACTPAMPCTSLQAALDTKRPYIKMAGTTDAHVSIIDQDVTVFAEAGAKLTSKTTGNLLVVGGRSHVSIYDLIVTGSTGIDDPGGTGILLPMGNTATLSLVRAVISNSEGTGLLAYGGIVNVTKCTVSGNDIAGLGTQGGELNVTQSKIQNNGEGGIYLKDPTRFRITNNFIYGNGGPIANAGGLYLEAASNSAASNQVAFNTIIDNQSDMNESNLAGGVVCNVPGFVAANNLIFRNLGGPNNNTQVSGTCQYGNSVLTTPSNPGFASTTDYHLTAQTPSAILDKGDCGGIQVDIDGDARPRGAGCDLGADEFR